MISVCIPWNKCCHICSYKELFAQKEQGLFICCNTKWVAKQHIADIPLLNWIDHVCELYYDLLFASIVLLFADTDQAHAPQVDDEEEPERRPGRITVSYGLLLFSSYLWKIFDFIFDIFILFILFQDDAIVSLWLR